MIANMATKAAATAASIPTTTTTTTTAPTNPNNKAGVVDTSTTTATSNTNVNANNELDESRCADNDSTATTQQNATTTALENAPTSMVLAATTTITAPTIGTAVNKKLLLFRRFKDSADGILRNFNSLPLFVYATSTTTHATSADGVGVAKEAATAAAAIAVNSIKNNSHELGRHTIAATTITNGRAAAVLSALECDTSNSSQQMHLQHLQQQYNNNSNNNCTLNHHRQPHTMATTLGGVNPTSVIVGTLASGGGSGSSVGVSSGSANLVYPHHINLNHATAVAAAALINQHPHHHLHHHPHLLSHQTPYSNNYPLQHSNSHQHIHSEQTKSLQELQHEVGALLEFRDLVIETFPDLKQKMASMSSSSASTNTTASTSAIVAATNSNTSLTANGGGTSNSATPATSGTNTLTHSSSLVSRREWEPGIRSKRKLSSNKDPSASSVAAASGGSASSASHANGAAAELSSSSLTRSRSNSHSGKKEPKSGENNNGSVVQDSGFSTETSSSKEAHSASSTNGALTAPLATNRLSCAAADDELLNLLDVIHRKSNRLRDEVEQLQNYERLQLKSDASADVSEATRETVMPNTEAALKLTPQTFREHVERLNKEDIQQLRKERDRLLDKLAEMEAETLTGRIKAAKMSDQVEELICVKKDLEEQLKLAMAQKLELSLRVQQLQLQQTQLQSKSSSSTTSQSEYSSSPRNFLSSAATTVLSTDNWTPVSTHQQRRQNTFQPVVLEQTPPHNDLTNYKAFLQSAGSDNQHQQQQMLGRLDGIISTPGSRNTKSRSVDSKRFAAILLETNVVELQRHLLTLTVQNQVLMQKLEQSNKSKTTLAKRLDKSKEDVEDLRFQLEEKNIELEGTKAQLRILEARLHSTTPSSGATTNSYLHSSSHHDYETNRSSASTTLVLSRRGGESHMSTDLRSATPSNAALQLARDMQQHNSSTAMTTPTQISTPSMKAMVPLAMDELQQHSSSTESAHDQEITSDNSGVGGVNGIVGGRMMSASVGGMSPFEQQKNNATTAAQQSIKKYIAAGSKPSKIPLPGSKAAAYFAGKPPSGRATTAARSPPSANGSYASSNKSSLSRSTGNLLYNKSPNSLKRADSAQSIRKENTSSNTTSLSTNTSRSSTNSSSIPLATTPYNTSSTNSSGSQSARAAGAGYSATMPAATPSSRALQNSPLPKLKRETIASRVRHLDSLSRAHQQHAKETATATSPNTSTLSPDFSGSSFLVSSTPKASAITAHINATLRRDVQLSSNSFSHGSQQFLRRATGGNASAASAANSSAAAARRFSSASVVGARVAAAARNHDHATAAEQHHGSNNSGSNASDSDSGKHAMPDKLYDYINNNNGWCTEARVVSGKCCANNQSKLPHKQDMAINCMQQQQTQVWPDLWSTANRPKEMTNKLPLNDDDDVDEQQEDYSLQSISASAMDNEQRCDKLLVTFDYGYSDSIDMLLHEQQASYAGDYEERSFSEYAMTSNDFDGDCLKLRAEDASSTFGSHASAANDYWFKTSNASDVNKFQVHHMRHQPQLAYSVNSLVTEYDDDAMEIDSLQSSRGIITKRAGEKTTDEVFYDSLECD